MNPRNLAGAKTVAEKCLFSVDDFIRMIDAGIFAERTGQIELMDGELIHISPASAEHSDVIAWLTRWSIINTQPHVVGIRVQSSLGIPELDSVPEPDIAWVRAGSYRHEYPHANDVGLLIEVCVTSGPYDRGRKADLYASAGISDYWLVDVNEQCIEIRRQPSSTGYQQVKVLDRSASVQPLCQTETILRIADLFPES